MKNSDAASALPDVVLNLAAAATASGGNECVTDGSQHTRV